MQILLGMPQWILPDVSITSTVDIAEAPMRRTPRWRGFRAQVARGRSWLLDGQVPAATGRYSLLA